MFFFFQRYIRCVFVKEYIRIERVGSCPISNSQHQRRPTRLLKSVFYFYLELSRKHHASMMLMYFGFNSHNVSYLQGLIEETEELKKTRHRISAISAESKMAGEEMAFKVCTRITFMKQIFRKLINGLRGRQRILNLSNEFNSYPIEIRYRGIGRW